MKEFPVFAEITGLLHSACTFDTEKVLFLFDEKNMYVLEWTAEKLLPALLILICTALVSITLLLSTTTLCAKIDQEARALVSDSLIWKVSSEENRTAWFC